MRPVERAIYTCLYARARTGYSTSTKVVNDSPKTNCVLRCKKKDLATIRFGRLSATNENPLYLGKLPLSSVI